ncbi:MAG: hypothetical protein GX663_03010 [Clostridiales bacterium]|nr:hypothetical protein [Clostridiales bacterium]
MLSIESIALEKVGNEKKPDEKCKIVQALTNAYDDGVFEQFQEFPDIMEIYSK